MYSELLVAVVVMVQEVVEDISGPNDIAHTMICPMYAIIVGLLDHQVCSGIRQILMQNSYLA